jgi:hypothetical protein
MDVTATSGVRMGNISSTPQAIRSGEILTRDGLYFSVKLRIGCDISKASLYIIDGMLLYSFNMRSLEPHGRDRHGNVDAMQCKISDFPIRLKHRTKVRLRTSYSSESIDVGAHCL